VQPFFSQVESIMRFEEKPGSQSEEYEGEKQHKGKVDSR
jgi:hypothetical protein